MEDSRINQAWWGLRLVFGLVPVAAGADKFFNLLTNWEQYLSPLARSMLPFSAGSFMRLVGIIEIVVGLVILTRWTRVGAYAAAAWLLLIALNLLATGHYFDIAARDVALAVGAFALARLEEARAGARQRVPGHAAVPVTSPAHT